MDQDNIKHMEFIQNVTTRMNANSFMIKGWMITLVSALFALAAKDANIRYILITYIAIPSFWILNAYYLSQERQYRDLYDSVASNRPTTFSMDSSPYDTGRNTWFRTFFPKTLLMFYPTVVGITIVIMFCIT